MSGFPLSLKGAELEPPPLPDTFQSPPVMLPLTAYAPAHNPAGLPHQSSPGLTKTPTVPTAKC